MIEVIVSALVSIPAAWAGYAAGIMWVYPRGCHEVGVSARRLCAEHGCPVERREAATHAA